MNCWSNVYHIYIICTFAWKLIKIDYCNSLSVWQADITKYMKKFLVSFYFRRRYVLLLILFYVFMSLMWFNFILKAHMSKMITSQTNEWYTIEMFCPLSNVTHPSIWSVPLTPLININKLIYFQYTQFSHMGANFALNIIRSFCLPDLIVYIWTYHDKFTCTPDVFKSNSCLCHSYINKWHYEICNENCHSFKWRCLNVILSVRLCTLHTKFMINKPVMYLLYFPPS